MSKILSEHDERQLERQVTTLLQSKEGREIGRWFLVERGKPGGGNLAQIKQEIFDIMSAKINALYGAEAPVQSR